MSEGGRDTTRSGAGDVAGLARLLTRSLELPERTGTRPESAQRSGSIEIAEVLGWCLGLGLTAEGRQVPREGILEDDGWNASSRISEGTL